MRHRIRFLVIATAILVAAYLKPAAAGESISTSADPDGLIGAYRAFDLPIPPATALLVSFQEGWTIDESHPLFRVGFLLKRAVGKEPALLLIGTEEVPVSDALSIVDPEQIKVEAVRSERNETRAGLATAIQCRMRGWKRLADGLQKTSLEESVGAGIHVLPEPVVPPREGLAGLAWSYWTGRIVKTGTERGPIADHLQMLIALDPTLNNPNNADLLRSLKKTLVPSTAKPGSIDAAIDQLIDDDQASWFPLPIGDLDSKCMAIGMFGFQAVPALIAHLDDDRLTRSLAMEFINPRGETVRVNELANDLLIEISGDELYTHWPNRQTRLVPKDVAATWWNSVRGQSEEAYFTHHVLPKEGGFPHQIMLKVLATRYPARLPEIFVAALETHGSIAMGPLVEALGGSSLPREQKRALLLRAADVKDLSRRIEALHQLKSVDETIFVNELVKTVNELPKTPAGPYWLAPESHVPIHMSFEPLTGRAWQRCSPRPVARMSGFGCNIWNAWSPAASKTRPSGSSVSPS